MVFSAVSIPLMTLSGVFLSIFISRRHAMRLIRRYMCLYGRVVTWLPFPLVRVCYEACEQNKGQGPFIFVCNHRSAVDPFLMSYLPYEAVQVVNVWPFRIPVFGAYARLAGYLNINLMPYEEFLKESLGLLKDGASMIFFPEGTRSVGREMGNFRGAAFRLSLESKTPIVPICISGTEEVMPKGMRLLRPGKIRLRTLPAIQWKDVRDLSAYSFKNMVRQIISNELAVMEPRTSSGFITT